MSDTTITILLLIAALAWADMIREWIQRRR